MKIAFIFAFVLLCGLAFCKERAEFEDEIADVADPKGHCKSNAHTFICILYIRRLQNIWDQYYHHTEKNKLNYNGNQLTDFFITERFALNGSIHNPLVKFDEYYYSY